MIKKITVTYKQTDSFETARKNYNYNLTQFAAILRDEANYFLSIANILDRLTPEIDLSEEQVRAIISEALPTVEIYETVYTKRKKTLSIPYLFIHLEN